MKRVVLVLVALTLLVPLSACRPKEERSDTPAASSSPVTQEYENALPLIGQPSVARRPDPAALRTLLTDAAGRFCDV